MSDLEGFEGEKDERMVSLDDVDEIRKTPCVMCGKTFGQALDDDSEETWTVHWGTIHSTTIEAETCGDECADKYEAKMGRNYEERGRP